MSNQQALHEFERVVRDIHYLASCRLMGQKLTSPEEQPNTTLVRAYVRATTELHQALVRDVEAGTATPELIRTSLNTVNLVRNALHAHLPTVPARQLPVVTSEHAAKDT